MAIRQDRTKASPKRSPRKGTKRTDLEFIMFAVRQAKAAERFGFTRNWACRNLKTALTVFWQMRRLKIDSINRKDKIVRSVAAIGVARSGCRAEHTVPMKWIVDRLMDESQPSLQSLERMLNKYYVVTLVTAAEDELLRKAGLRYKMPDDWDGKDPYARYHKVGIRLAKT